MTRQRVIGSRTGEPSNESHKDKEGWSEMLLGAGSEPRSGRFFKGKMSVLCVEGTLLEGRDSVVLRARDGGWGECLQGTDKTHFVREPVSHQLLRLSRGAATRRTSCGCHVFSCGRQRRRLSYRDTFDTLCLFLQKKGSRYASLPLRSLCTFCYLLFALFF